MPLAITMTGTQFQGITPLEFSMTTQPTQLIMATIQSQPTPMFHHTAITTQHRWNMI
jgi:hypothetical protein